METDRCPGCGAKVRLDSSWCSLCYHDLRPEPLLVTAAGPAEAADGAPLVEASLEPEASEWSTLYGADDDIVDAELVGEDGRIIAPRSGSHDDHPDGASPAPVSVAVADDEASGLAGLTWSCKCGEILSFEHNACTVCGNSFLGDLRDGNGGRHRPGGRALSWLPESRQVRLAASAVLGILFAVLILGIITLFG